MVLILGILISTLNISAEEIKDPNKIEIENIKEEIKDLQESNDKLEARGYDLVKDVNDKMEDRNFQVMLSIVALVLLNMPFMYFTIKNKKRELEKEIRLEMEVQKQNLMREYNEQLENMRENHRSQLYRMIEERISTNDLLKNKKVAILKNGRFDESVEFKIIMDEIANKTTLDISSGDSLQRFKDSNFDLAIIYNEDKKPADESVFMRLVKEYLDDESNTAYLYYGKGYYEPDIGSEKLNFANSKATIYNRIIETLQFQDLLMKHRGGN